MGKAALEIGVDGNVDGRADRREMRQHLVDRDFVVGLADGPGKAGAGRGDRLEAEMSQGLGAADVERVRQHEAAALMQAAESRALVLW